jgi:hypothetical protein
MHQKRPAADKEAQRDIHRSHPYAILRADIFSLEAYASGHEASLSSKLTSRSLVHHGERWDPVPSPSQRCELPVTF